MLRDVKPIEAKHPEIGLLLGMLEAGTRTARAELGEVSDEALVWQPRPGGHSIAGILIHLAACEAGWLHQVAAGQPEPDYEVWRLDAQTQQYDGKWITPPRKPLAWYYAQQDEVRARSVELLSQLDDPSALRPIAWRPEVECTLRWIINHVIEHESYHTGQAVLLNLMAERQSRRPTI